MEVMNRCYRKMQKKANYNGKVDRKILEAGL